jgi:hypothetical protein
MFEYDEKLITTLSIYLGACYILYEMKHPKMFNNKGEFKNFGLNKSETIFPFWLVTTIIGLFVYTFLVTREKF